MSDEKDEDDNNTEERKADTPKDEPPEIDAEIVELDAPEPEQAFDEAADAKSNAAPAQKTMISPGVLFFCALVVVAIGAGVYWFLTRELVEPVRIETTNTTGEEPEETGQTSEVAQSETPAKTENDLVAAAKTVGQSENAAPVARGTDPFSDALNPNATGAKIENEDFSDLEPASLGLEPETETTEETFTPMGETSPGPNEIEGFSLDDDDAASGSEPDDARDPFDTFEDGLDAAPRGGENFSATDTDQLPVLAETVDDEPSSDPVATEPAALDARPGVSPSPAETLQTLLDEERLLTTSLRDEIIALNAQLDTVTRDLDQARTELDGAMNASDALRQRVLDLEAAVSEGPAAQSALALTRLQSAINQGTPFRQELAIIAKETPAAPGLNILAAFAETGAPTMQDIRAQFAEAAREGFAIAAREQADDVFSRYGARMAALVNIRPASPQPGDSPGAVLSRAEDAVERGALGEAIAEIESLPTPAQDAMAEWITLARNRSRIDDAIDNLNRAMTNNSSLGQDPA